MKGLGFDLQRVAKENRKAVAVFFTVVERFWGRKLAKEEVQRIYKEGVELTFAGHAPFHVKTLKYVAFYREFSSVLPLRVRVECMFSTSDHKQMMGSDRKNVIVAGSLSNMQFETFSDTWLLDVHKGSAVFVLGAAVNALVIKHFGFERQT